MSVLKHFRSKGLVNTIMASLPRTHGNGEIDLVFHLGAHKTGTSLIQKYMRDNRSLIERNRVGFTVRSQTDVFIGWGRPGHMKVNLPELARLIVQHRDRRFRAFVVSHENTLGRPFRSGQPGLYPGAVESMEILVDIFKPMRPRFVYYIRSQEKFMESYYLQTVHEGRYASFRDWKSSIDTNDLSWKPLIETIRSAFGNDSVIVKDFEEEIAGSQELFLRKFFETFIPDLKDKDFMGFAYEKFRNPSVGDLGLQIALAANPLLKTVPERKAMRTFLQSKFSNLNYPRPALLDDSEKKAIRERYSQENTALVTRAESFARSR
jgi:hypothetical protein